MWIDGKIITHPERIDPLNKILRKTGVIGYYFAEDNMCGFVYLDDASLIQWVEKDTHKIPPEFKTQLLLMGVI